MDKNELPLIERRALFDTHLRELCLISVDDAGLSSEDVDRYIVDRESGSEIREAVQEYARDYDLTIATGVWVL